MKLELDVSQQDIRRIRAHGPFKLRWDGKDEVGRARFYNAIGNIEFEGSNSDSLNQAVLVLLNAVCSQSKTPVSLYDMIDEAAEKMGYQPGHEVDCPRRQEPFEFAKCNCGPMPPPDKIYMDDERRTPEGWFRTYSVKRTIELLQEHVVQELSLDNDLGENQPEGYLILDWLEEQVFHNPSYHVPVIHIHSANPTRVAYMQKAVESIARLQTRST